MTDYRSLNHTKWECKYHVVFIPKYRKKWIFGTLRTELRDVFRTLASQKESQIEEGHLMADHVHIPEGGSCASPLGDPPALPGRQQKFDRSGSPKRKLPLVSRQSITRGSFFLEHQKSKPHEMGV